jgi:hypothetical protein
MLPWIVEQAMLKTRRFNHSAARHVFFRERGCQSRKMLHRRCHRLRYGPHADGHHVKMA